jgi:hypothetical protein
MFPSFRHISEDGGFPVVLVTTVTCLALMFWRVTLLVLCVVLVTVLAYGAFALHAQAG